MQGKNEVVLFSNMAFMPDVLELEQSLVVNLL
jgi:hypothetical protein